MGFRHPPNDGTWGLGQVRDFYEVWDGTDVQLLTPTLVVFRTVAGDITSLTHHFLVTVTRRKFPLMGC